MDNFSVMRPNHASTPALRDHALSHAAREGNQDTTFLSSLPVGNANKRHRSVSDNVTHKITESASAGPPSTMPLDPSIDVAPTNPVKIGLVTDLSVELKLDNEHKTHLFRFHKVRCLDADLLHPY